MQLEFEADGKGDKYKIEEIQDNMVYVKELKGHLLELYYSIE